MDDEPVLGPLIKSVDAGDADVPAGDCKFFRCGFCDGPLSKLTSETTGPKCPPPLVTSTNGEFVVVVVLVVVDVPLRSGVNGIIIVGRTLGPCDGDDEEEDESGDDTTTGIPVGGLKWLYLDALKYGCMALFGSFEEPNLKLDEDDAVELGEIHWYCTSKYLRVLGHGSLNTSLDAAILHFSFELHL